MASPTGCSSGAEAKLQGALDAYVYVAYGATPARRDLNGRTVRPEPSNKVKVYVLFATALAFNVAMYATSRMGVYLSHTLKTKITEQTAKELITPTEAARVLAYIAGPTAFLEKSSAICLIVFRIQVAVGLVLLTYEVASRLHQHVQDRKLNAARL